MFVVIAYKAYNYSWRCGGIDWSSNAFCKIGFFRSHQQATEALSYVYADFDSEEDKGDLILKSFEIDEESFVNQMYQKDMDDADNFMANIGTFKDLDDVHFLDRSTIKEDALRLYEERQRVAKEAKLKADAERKQQEAEAAQKRLAEHKLAEQAREREIFEELKKKYGDQK